MSILYEAEGFSVKTVDLPGKGKQMCVLVRKAPEGEYEFEISTSLDSLITEQMDGDLCFRQGQAEDMHESLSAQVCETANIGDNNKVLDDLYPGQQKVAAASASSGTGVLEEYVRVSCCSVFASAVIFGGYGLYAALLVGFA